jgi:hypothetical protein
MLLARGAVRLHARDQHQHDEDGDQQQREEHRLPDRFAELRRRKRSNTSAMTELLSAFR